MSIAPTELKNKLNISSFVLRGESGADVVEILKNYAIIKSQQGLAEKGGSKELMQLVRNNPEIVNIANEYQELENKLKKAKTTIEEVKDKNEQAKEKKILRETELKLETMSQKIFDITGKTPEQLAIIVSMVEGFDVEKADILTHIRQQLKSLNKELYQLLPEAIKGLEYSQLQELSLKEFSLLIEEVVKENELNSVNPHSLFFR